MKIKKIIKDISVEEVRGSKEIEITGVCSNSKFVAPGNLFIAKKGTTVNGASYIPEAISAGAVAILTDFYDPSLKNITQIIHHDVSFIEPIIAARFNQYPSDHLLMVGITGTNGKTTTAYLIKHVLDTLNQSCGLIGSIEYIIGSHTYQATHTTPDVSTNQKLLREMVHSGCKSAVMEVTSHALQQGRVSNIHFDIAIFTNLTQEHLDYHGTMEEYCLAKNKLFKGLTLEKKKKKDTPILAIVNTDDPYCQKILDGCQAQVITYGINQPADLQASEIHLTTKGTGFFLQYKEEKYPVSIPLIGRFNVYNCLATIACILSQGFSMDAILEAVQKLPHVPARLEAVPNHLGLKIYVDFAHTPDALKNVLCCLNEFKTGRIITVFGCGGNRDKSKRPLMAKVCENYSDQCIVTSDNPRTEDPKTIIDEIVKGFSDTNIYISELDRRKAIEKAIGMATPSDIVLIAGKGHESYQIFAHHTVEFDDRIIARETCDQLSAGV